VSSDTLDFLKWFIGVPSALVATVTLPILIRKHILECRKLQLEIRHLEGSSTINAATSPGALTRWMYHYWSIPCYGSLGLFALLTVLARSAVWLFVGMFMSLTLFMLGSAINEKYKDLH